MSVLSTMLSKAMAKTEDGRPPNILQALLVVQAELGYVPPASVPEIAAALGVTDAETAGVLSFYPALRTRPPARHVIRVCQGESCVANHCKHILKELEAKLNIRLGETTKDERFTLEKVSCIGNCGVSPTIMIDEDVHGRVTPALATAVLRNYR